MYLKVHAQHFTTMALYFSTHKIIHLILTPNGLHKLDKQLAR